MDALSQPSVHYFHTARTKRECGNQALLGLRDNGDAYHCRLCVVDLHRIQNGVAGCENQILGGGIKMRSTTGEPRRNLRVTCKFVDRSCKLILWRSM